MEYSLYSLKKHANLQKVSLTEIINTLNLIGFEVDDTFFEPLSNYLLEKRLLLKIPANREDLLNERFLVNDLATIFNFILYKPWEKINKKYNIFLKKKYFEKFSYEKVLINDSTHAFHFYTIKINSLKQGNSPLWIQKKLIKQGIKVNKNYLDIFALIENEYGQKFFSSLAGMNNEDSFSFETKYNETINSNTFPQLLANQVVIKNKETIIHQLGEVKDLVSFSSEKFFIHSLYYDINLDPLLINRVGNNISLKALRRSFFKSFIISFERLISLLEIIYYCDIEPIIYLNKNSISKNYRSRILKLTKKSSNELLQIKEYNHKVFKKANLKLVCETNQDLYFEIPETRGDLKRSIDLVEEYCRFIGYRNFQEILPTKTIKYSTREKNSIKFIKQFFLNLCFTEVITNSLGEGDYKIEKTVTLTNPLNLQLSSLRQSILPKLLDIFLTNSYSDITVNNFFEIGRIFQNTPIGILEEENVSGIFQLKSIKKHQTGSDIEWFKAKAILENLLQNFGYTNFSTDLIKNLDSNFYPSRAINFKYKNKILGTFGELNPKFIPSGKNKFAVYAFELNLAYFKDWRLKKSIVTYKEYSKYPSITKDLSFSIVKTINLYALKQKIKISCKNLKSVEFFDIYFNDLSLNLAIRLIFQSDVDTLQTRFVDEEIERVKTVLENEFNAIIRK